MPKEDKRKKRIAEGMGLLKELGIGEYTEEERQLGAGLLGMIGAIGCLTKAGYDPVEVCKMLMDDDNNQRVIGRKLWEPQTGVKHGV